MYLCSIPDSSNNEIRVHYEVQRSKEMGDLTLNSLWWKINDNLVEQLFDTNELWMCSILYNLQLEKDNRNLYDDYLLIKIGIILFILNLDYL